MSLTSGPSRDLLTIWTIVLLVSGQGFRYLVGVAGYAVLAIATVVLLFMAFRPTWRKLKPPLLIGSFVGLAALTTLWSGTRAITALAVVTLVFTTAIAFITARGTTSGHYMVLLYRGLQASLVLGLVFELVVAIIIRHPIHPLVNDFSRVAEEHSSDAEIWWSHNLLFEGGPIQGFVGNRNPFGAIALLAAIMGYVMMLERRVSRADAVATLAAAVAVHFLTRSATVTVALLYVVILALAAFAIRRAPVRWKRPISFTTLALTAVGGVLTIKYRDLIFDLLDRSPDATHRADIWAQVVHYAQERPEGWGYVGYWPIWSDPYKSIVESTDVVAAHAHNAYLDAWLQTGLIGMVLFLVIMVLLFGGTWRLVERASRGDTFIPVAWSLLAAALAIQGLTESRPLVEGGWYLIVALFCLGPQLFTLTLVDEELVHYGSRDREPPPRVRPRG
ncbi:O-antigen ligase family protein [Demequina sp.]|uniref:O-antigen ligase family protein n=1 Tax=Demequina sp. TaxID=2050685 RepID=UPI003D0BFB4D